MHGCYSRRVDDISGSWRPTLETGWCLNGYANHVFCMLHFRALISQDVAVRSQSSSRAGEYPTVQFDYCDPGAAGNWNPCQTKQDATQNTAHQRWELGVNQHGIGTQKETS